MSKTRPKRILIAGHEIGGQMQLLAETLRKRGVNATSLAFNKDFREFRNDLHINPRGIKGHLKRVFFFIGALFKYDVFHFFWGISLLTIWRFHLIDLPVLKILNKKIIIHFRGTDIVNIRYYDYLVDKAKGKVVEVVPPLSRLDQEKKLKTWLKYADEVLVSTPDLLFASKDAILSPQVVELETWQPPKNGVTVKEGGHVLKIVHAPTRRNTKGTEFVLDTITALQQDGYPLELILIENKPYKEIQTIFEQCDIGIDQLLHGWYGKVSVELMALGKPVVCYIDEKFRLLYPDLPIVNASPTSLKKVLIELINNAKRREELGEKGIKYVRMHHDVNKIVDSLIMLY